MSDEMRSLLQWAFGGIGVAVLGWIGTLLFKRFWSEPLKNENKVSVNQTVNINGTQSDKKISSNRKKFETIDEAKSNAKLLFIDDDTRFNVVKILRNAGWTNTEIVKDTSSLEESQLRFADIVFVDIQGVGKKMNFKDEGLGLSMAIRERYPEKYLVIYSAERAGDRFEEAIRKADDQLYKHADSYEFEKCVCNLLVRQ